MKRLLIGLLLLALTGPAQAALNVVATTTNMGMLVDAVAGDEVQLRVLAPPNRDTHYLQVRPNMMAALRRADLVVSVGAELEIGWLPPAIQGAHNPRLQPGRSGYFEAGAQVELIDTDVAADRAQGDVHPAGNPHVYLDPVRMGQIAEALAERLAELDSANAEHYRSNARDFVRAVEERLPEWKQRAQTAPGVVLYHKDANYLTARLSVQVLGYLEPLPGIPPTGRHLRELVQRMQGESGVIIHTNFQPERGAQFLSGQLDWPVYRLSLNIEQGGTAQDYFKLIDAWVNAFSGEGG